MVISIHVFSFPRNEELQLGNLLDDDFEHIWQNNNLLNNLRNKDLLQEIVEAVNRKTSVVDAEPGHIHILTMYLPQILDV